MKFWIKYSLLAFTFLALVSCGSDDDICVSGEATPRLKIMFVTDSSGKPKTLDLLYVDVDYGKGNVKNMVTKTKVESVLIPLRVDDNPYTDFYVRTAEKGDSAKIRVNYTTEAIYVSPACGFKKTYKNVKYELLKKNPVLNIESNQNEILDENKTHLYLKF